MYKFSMKKMDGVKTSTCQNSLLMLHMTYTWHINIRFFCFTSDFMIKNWEINIFYIWLSLCALIFICDPINQYSVFIDWDFYSTTVSCSGYGHLPNAVSVNVNVNAWLHHVVIYSMLWTYCNYFPSINTLLRGV